MSTTPKPSRRAVLKTSGAAALMSAAPFPARANSAPQRPHHAATPVVLQFDVTPREAALPSAAPGISARPVLRND